MNPLNNDKLRAFIASSSEGLPVARAIQFQLKDLGIMQLWSEGVFDLGKGVVETILLKLDDYDFGVFLLTPDDKTTSRDHEQRAPRDNVLIELGLFMGRLGRERTYLVYCRKPETKIPSDLHGMTLATLNLPEDINDMPTAVAPACYEIRRAIGLAGPRLGMANLRAAVQVQEQGLARQQDIINQLVIFSMSQSIYQKLRDLYFAKMSGRGEWIYGSEYEEDTRREFLFLRDHGFIGMAGGGYFAPGPAYIGRDLVPLIELTPIGNFYVEQREGLLRRHA